MQKLPVQKVQDKPSTKVRTQRPGGGYALTVHAYWMLGRKCKDHVGAERPAGAERLAGAERPAGAERHM